MLLRRKGVLVGGIMEEAYVLSLGTGPLIEGSIDDLALDFRITESLTRKIQGIFRGVRDYFTSPTIEGVHFALTPYHTGSEWMDCKLKQLIRQNNIPYKGHPWSGLTSHFYSLVNHPYPFIKPDPDIVAIVFSYRMAQSLLDEREERCGELRWVKKRFRKLTREIPSSVYISPFDASDGIDKALKKAEMEGKGYTVFTKPDQHLLDWIKEEQLKTSRLNKLISLVKPFF